MQDTKIRIEKIGEVGKSQAATEAAAKAIYVENE